jgi:hypothetical protein
VNKDDLELQNAVDELRELGNLLEQKGVHFCEEEKWRDFLSTTEEDSL